MVHALRFSSSEHVETDRGDQYSALDHVLSPTFNIQERHAVVQASQNQRTQNCAKDRASSTHQTRATDDARSDRIELHQTTGVRRRAADARSVQNRSEPSQCSHHTERGQDVSPQIYSRQTRRVRIAANRVKITAKG